MTVTQVGTPPDSGDHDDKPGFWSRAWTKSLPYAAVVVALIVGMGAFVAIKGGDRPVTVLPPPAPTVANPTASAAAPVRPVPSDTDQRIPTLTPTVAWSPYEGVLLPYSWTAGPLVVNGPTASDYAHTPLGALLATCQITVRHLVAPHGGWRTVLADQVDPDGTSGQGRANYTALRSTTDDTSPPAGYGQSAGFRFVTYTPDVAVIQLATQFSDGTLIATTHVVHWTGGDWKLQLQPDGSDSPTAQQLASISGFVPWGSVGG